MEEGEYSYWIVVGIGILLPLWPCLCRWFQTRNYPSVVAVLLYLCKSAHAVRVSLLVVHPNPQKRKSKTLWHHLHRRPLEGCCSSGTGRSRQTTGRKHPSLSAPPWMSVLCVHKGTLSPLASPRKSRNDRLKMSSENLSQGRQIFWVHCDRIRKILLRRETFDYVEFRRYSTMFKWAWHCARYSVIFATVHTSEEWKKWGFGIFSSNKLWDFGICVLE